MKIGTPKNWKKIFGTYQRWKIRGNCWEIGGKLPRKINIYENWYG